MTTTTVSNTSAILASLALILVPAAVLSERVAERVWQNRLYLPAYQEEDNRHTPVHTMGTYLPPALTTSHTYTQAQSPLFLTGVTTIPVNVTVTIEPGVIVRAHEFAALNVAGTLIAAGTSEQPVTFTTNEVHPDNQTWGGIIVADGGTATLTNTLIEYASPSLTCLAGSVARADNLHMRFGLVGLHTESALCTLVHSRLQAIQYGIVARGVVASIKDTVISAGKQEILTTNY